MARDFENIHDIDDLSDDELRDLVRETLAEHKGIDHNDITVDVAGGAVTLSGRVGNDSELRVAERVITDLLGVGRVRNDLVVNTMRRAESPAEIDEHLADESEREGLLLGDRAVPISPEAEHLAEDLDARLNGTTDVQSAIERGTPWIPPETPTPEGHTGDETDLTG